MLSARGGVTSEPCPGVAPFTHPLCCELLKLPSPVSPGRAQHLRQRLVWNRRGLSCAGDRLFQRPQDTHEGQGQTHPHPSHPRRPRRTLATSRVGARCLPGGGHHAVGPASLVLAWAVGTGWGGGRWECTLHSTPRCIPHRPPHHPLRSSRFAEGKASSTNKLNLQRSFTTNLTPGSADFSHRRQTFSISPPWARGPMTSPQRLGGGADIRSVFDPGPSPAWVNRSPFSPGFLHSAFQQQRIGETRRQMFKGAPSDTALCTAAVCATQLLLPAPASPCPGRASAWHGFALPNGLPTRGPRMYSQVSQGVARPLQKLEAGGQADVSSKF